MRQARLKGVREKILVMLARLGGDKMRGKGAADGVRTYDRR